MQQYDILSTARISGSFPVQKRRQTWTTNLFSPCSHKTQDPRHAKKPTTHTLIPSSSPAARLDTAGVNDCTSRSTMLTHAQCHSRPPVSGRQQLSVQALFGKGKSAVAEKEVKPTPRCDGVVMRMQARQVADDTCRPQEGVLSVANNQRP